MTLRAQILRLLAQEDLNFLLTNRIPRRLLTRFMGWFSKIEQPVVRDISIALWRFFSDLDLSEAKEPRFRCLRQNRRHQGFSGQGPRVHDRGVAGRSRSRRGSP